MELRKKIINGKRQCCSCLKWSELNNYRRRKFRVNMGYYSYCKKCEADKARVYLKSHPRYVRGNYVATCGNLITNSRKRAKLRGLKHTITRFDIEELLYKQDNKCALTGIPITFDIDEKYKGKRQAPPNRVSLDRIDNKKGYTKDNIQMVCDFVNRFRNFITLDDFIKCCILVAKKYKKDNLIALQTDMKMNPNDIFSYLLTKGK